MSGRLTGVQQRILDINKKAIFINCDNHSLNLAGLHAANEHTYVISMFGTLDAIFNFFSSSTTRWQLLSSRIGMTVKRSVPTRWSSRYEAVSVVQDKIDELIELLEEISNEADSFSSETRSDATRLLANILSFTFLTLLPFWKPILSLINVAQKRLQHPKMDFREASIIISAVRDELQKDR